MANRAFRRYSAVGDHGENQSIPQIPVEMSTRARYRSAVIVGAVMIASLLCVDSPATAQDATGREKATPLYESKISEVYWGVLGSEYNVPKDQRDMVRRQISELNSKGQQVISCTYGPNDPKKGTGFAVYRFWYKAPPSNIRELLASAPSHPARVLGAKAVDACPASSVLASQVGTRLDILAEGEALRDQRMMSVSILIGGSSNTPESAYRADLETRLRNIGITVLVEGEYPSLQLSVNTLQTYLGSVDVTAYSISLDFVQLLPTKAAPLAKFVQGKTWSTGRFGVLGWSAALGSPRSIANDLASEFIAAYSKVNPKR